MKSTFIQKDGTRIVVTAIHGIQAVCLEKFDAVGKVSGSMHIPAEAATLLGIEIAKAGAVTKSGPCSIRR